MKSKRIEENKLEPEIEYPCLMTDGSNKVFLMKSEEDGFLVYQQGSGATYPLGDEAEGWGIGGFKPFNGKIELSNE